MTYNHAFTLAFAVPNSKHREWWEALADETEKPAIIEALLQRVKMLETNHAEYLEALEGFDTYEEEN